MKDSALKRFLVKKYEIFVEEKRILNLRLRYHLSIMDSDATIDYVIKNKCSVARFGDGEFKLMLKTDDIGFQKRNDKLAERLFDVLDDLDKRLLVCVPSTMNTVKGCSEDARNYWLEWGKVKNNHINVVNMLRQHCGKYRFGDTEMTRTYIDWEGDERAKRLYPKLKKLWDNEDVLFIEGEQTRLGIGNDLFDNVKSVQRILAPATNAFEAYDRILEAGKKYGKDKLIIIALGPTATVLAHDLAKSGFRAMDVGHIDIEYEWFKLGTKTRVAIEGKYTNEAKGWTSVADCTDETYLSQIVEKIDC